MRQVNRTHPRLGEGLAVAMLAVKSKKTLLFVAPRGCGKSRITSFVAFKHPEVLLQDRLSVAGLASQVDAMNNFSGVIVVDDIAKTQTKYARITTMTTLAELVYSHYCISRMSTLSFEVKDFYGSALVNLQPVLLREIVHSPEWEASIQDKTIRYYHLYRPLKPNPMPPDVDLSWGIDAGEVKTPKLKGRLAVRLMEIGESQWGLSRLIEHLQDLLKASAALDCRREVNTSDYRLLVKILKPLMIESLVMDKRQFESQRFLESNALAILTEFVTYGQFTLDRISRDYKLSKATCYRIMARYSEDWVEVAKTPTVYAPSEVLREKLGKVGLL